MREFFQICGKLSHRSSFLLNNAPLSAQFPLWLWRNVWWVNSILHGLNKSLALGGMKSEENEKSEQGESHLASVRFHPY